MWVDSVGGEPPQTGAEQDPWTGRGSVRFPDFVQDVPVPQGEAGGVPVQGKAGVEPTSVSTTTSDSSGAAGPIGRSPSGVASGLVAASGTTLGCARHSSASRARAVQLGPSSRVE
jgi:hypothetical protein